MTTPKSRAKTQPVAPSSVGSDLGTKLLTRTIDDYRHHGPRVVRTRQIEYHLYAPPPLDFDDLVTDAPGMDLEAVVRTSEKTESAHLQAIVSRTEPQLGWSTSKLAIIQTHRNRFRWFDLAPSHCCGTRRWRHRRRPSADHPRQDHESSHDRQGIHGVGLEPAPPGVYSARKAV